MQLRRGWALTFGGEIQSGRGLPQSKTLARPGEAFGVPLSPRASDLTSPGSELEPREFLQQKRAIAVAVALRQIALVRAGEHSSKLLQPQQIRIERVDEGI